jgi:formylglycine-generating enzyme required for sulfatase activity
MDRHPVTRPVARSSQCVQEQSGGRDGWAWGPSFLLAHRNPERRSLCSQARCEPPVVKVSWYGAGFCGGGQRLPTEASGKDRGGIWEGRVCLRTITPDQANVEPPRHHIVGSLPPTLLACGLTAGVWQWCSDWYDRITIPPLRPERPKRNTKFCAAAPGSTERWRVATRRRQPLTQYFVSSPGSMAKIQGRR